MTQESDLQPGAAAVTEPANSAKGAAPGSEVAAAVPRAAQGPVQPKPAGPAVQGKPNPAPQMSGPAAKAPVAPPRPAAPQQPSAAAAAAAMAFSAGPIDLQSAASRRLFGRVTTFTFCVMVLLPLLLASLYYALLASDRYAVEIKFAIRSPAGIATPDLLGLVSGATASGSTQSDSYMVVDYLESRQFLDDIAAHVDLKAIYATDRADFLMRMPKDATKEEQVDYLPWVVSSNYAASSQIITVEAQAFTAENARDMAQAIIEVTSDLVNKVSDSARADTVRLAESELAHAEEALKEQRAAVAAFRDTEQSIDPSSTVAAHDSVIGQLQGELARRLTEMSSLREFLDENAPSVRVLQSQIDSIIRQIETERAMVGNGEASGSSTALADGTGSLNNSVTQYEALKVDLEFRQRAYLSALASVEAARLEAVRQQRYVAAFVLPSLPQDALYPEVMFNLFLLGIVAFLIWGVLTMFVHIVREHIS